MVPGLPVGYDFCGFRAFGAAGWKFGHVTHDAHVGAISSFIAPTTQCVGLARYSAQ